MTLLLEGMNLDAPSGVSPPRVNQAVGDLGNGNTAYRLENLELFRQVANRDISAEDMIQSRIHWITTSCFEIRRKVAATLCEGTWSAQECSDRVLHRAS